MHCLEKHTLLVTGASSGIGKAITERLLQLGHHVIGTSRDSQRLDQPHPAFSRLVLDLADLDSIESHAQYLLKNHANLNGVIHAAGYGQFGGLEQFSASHIQRMMTVNAVAPMLLTRALLPHLKKQSDSQVIFIGSEAALQGRRNGSVYCASKFAIRGFSQALRDECAKSGLRVHIINPGMVNSPFFDSLSFKPGALAEQHLLPDDIADCVEYLLKIRTAIAVDEINLSPLNKVIEFKK